MSNNSMPEYTHPEVKTIYLYTMRIEQQFKIIY